MNIHNEIKNPQSWLFLIVTLLLLSSICFGIYFFHN